MQNLGQNSSGTLPVIVTWSYNSTDFLEGTPFHDEIVGGVEDQTVFATNLRVRETATSSPNVISDVASASVLLPSARMTTIRKPSPAVEANN